MSGNSIATDIASRVIMQETQSRRDVRNMLSPFPKGVSMAATLEKTCSACGKHHTLCFVEGDMLCVGANYKYVCPEKQAPVEFTADASFDQVVYVRRRGSLSLTKA